MTNFYNPTYFSSNIFKYDYTTIVESIISEYNPKRIIDFGCGTGDLAKAFASQGVVVEAIDGYSNPDFKNAKFQNLPVKIVSKSGKIHLHLFYFKLLISY